MHLIARCAALVLLALSCVAPAWAEESHGTLALQWDNDRFAGSDRHYTNGLGGAWLWAPKKGPGALERLGAALPPVLADAERRVGVAVGQSIFTPERIGERDLIREDRPYAGWLYLGLAALSYGERRSGPVAGDLESFEIGLGVVGPAAFAEDVQTAWHEFFEFTRPHGWDNQLDNEPGLVLAYNRLWRFCADLDGVDCRTGARGAASVDLIPHVGGTLGNVFTYLAAGAKVRLGEGLRGDLGPSRTRPGLPGWSFHTPGDGFDWQVFAGAEGRLVFRNIFLDGNTFSDSHSVSKKSLVGDFEIGFTVSWDYGWPISVSYRHVLRTPEFDGQRGSDQFDSLSIAVSF
jgi:hypothetical protein